MNLFTTEIFFWHYPMKMCEQEFTKKKHFNVRSYPYCLKLASDTVLVRHMKEVKKTKIQMVIM